MNKKVTVQITIPAFNEQHAIQTLVLDVLSQQLPAATITKIEVVSDGSTDGTVQIVKELSKQHSVVGVKDHQARLGKGPRLNQVFRTCRADYLVVLDADLRIKDRLFLQKLLRPMIKHQVDLGAARVQELDQKNFLQHILGASLDWKRDLFENYRLGHNVYTCHGRARAFSRKLYQQFQIVHSSSEDSRSYFFTLTHGLKYQYVPEAVVWYRLPETFADHKKQSLRFFNSQSTGLADFDDQLLKREYHLPLSLKLSSFVRAWVKHPVELTLYICMLVYIKLWSLVQKNQPDSWSIATSTKGAASA